MSIKTGTATNYFNLLTILRDFLVNQGHAWGLTQTGTGNGRLTGAIGTSASVVQTITCTATSSTNFNVSGSVTGSMGTATVGVLKSHAQCAFTIVAGGTAFVSGDTFVFNLSPKWTQLRFGGCSDSALRTSSASGAAAMFDEDMGTDAISVANASLPLTVSVQMQSAIEVKAFSVWNGSSTSDAPTSYGLQYSDNGSSWTTAQTFSSLTWADTFVRKDHVLTSSAGSHLYWRLNVTTGGTNVKLSEVKLFADAGFKWACSNQFQFALRAPGVDNAQQIHVLGGINLDAGVGYWNFIFRGTRFWTDQNLDIADIPNVTGAHCHLLNNNSIAYWIVAHGGRFVLMTRISGVYEMSYCGFGLPYETPTNHPYPCIIAAPSNSQTLLFSNSTLADYRNPHDPGGGGMDVMIPSGVWRDVRNRDGGTAPDGNSGGPGFGKVWPWTCSDTADSSLVELIREAVDGSKPVLPAVILLPQDDHAWGEFDGVFYVSGSGNAAESLMQIGAVDHMNFPNVNRSSPHHWAAVAMD